MWIRGYSFFNKKGESSLLFPPLANINSSAWRVSGGFSVGVGKGGRFWGQGWQKKK
jgi:hypothetical protein